MSDSSSFAERRLTDLGRLADNAWAPWAVLVAVMVADYVVPLGVAIGVLYVMAVAIGAAARRDQLLWLGIVSTLATVVNFWIHASESTSWKSVTNRVLSVVVIWVVVALAARRTLAVSHTMRQSAERLANANRELEQFIFTAAHDLQAPLRTINSYALLVEDNLGADVPELERGYLSRITQSTERMSQLLTDLLNYARIEWDQQPETVDLNQVARAVINDLVGVNTARVDVECASLPTVPGHPTHLRLLLQNLVDNAIKFSKPDQPPRIRIRSKREEERWVISVEDNGIGFSESVQDRVFSVFQRLPEADAIPGTGIGLAHCRKIARMHHGEAWAESTPGVGSTFFFSLAAHPMSELVISAGIDALAKEQTI